MIEHILHSLSMETAIFLIVIAGFTLLFHLRFSSSIAHMAPAVLTTLGILGTFFGIAIGLLDFNVNDVQKSVPALIDGIKTAVWASAWGIFCALTVKLRQILFGASDAYDDTAEIGVTMDDLAQKLSSIERALVGNSRTDILTQFEMAHAENKAYLEKLHKTLETFCDRMVGGHSEAMVGALKEVVNNFNTQIDTQFGSSLQQLSHAVQVSNAEHKDTMLQAIDRYNAEFNTNIEKSIETAKDQLAQLGEEQTKMLEAKNQEFTVLSQSLARMVRQLHNNSILSIK